MLGQYNLLPLLKGWDYENHVVENLAVVRGVAPMSVVEVDKILAKELGWLKAITILTDDAYGTLIVEYRGGDRRKREIYSFWAEGMRAVGGWGPANPGLYLSRYDRPNPFSTQGIYVMGAFGGGFYGAAWPFVPAEHVRLYLPADSTQQTAYIRGEVFVIAITNEDVFIESLAKLASKGIQLSPELARFLERK